MPKLLGAISIRSCNYIFMSCIEGDPLVDLQPNLLFKLKSFIQSQLRGILQCLQKVPLQSKYLSSSDPPLCRDLQRHVQTSAKSISTKTEFKAFLVFTYRKLNPVYLDLITFTLSTSYQIVITYSDLCLKNILVLYITPNSIKITRLVDWEFSRAYLEYQEYVKALAGVS